MKKLIGRKGDIEFINEDLILVTSRDRDTYIVFFKPIKELDSWIKKLEIYSTEDGAISFGSWND